MKPKHDHPFTVHVRYCRLDRTRFEWMIHEPGSPRRHGKVSHPTFQDAMAEAKVCLAGLVLEWAAGRAMQVTARAGAGGQAAHAG